MATNAQGFRLCWALVPVFVLAVEARANPVAPRTPLGRAATLAAADPSTKVRLQAIVTLAELSDPRAVVPLGRVLQDPEPLVRALAAAALGQVCVAGGVAALQARLRGEHQPLVQRQARRALARCRAALGHKGRLVVSGRLELAAAVVDRGGGGARAGEEDLE
jgi:hypothetical protein